MITAQAISLVLFGACMVLGLAMLFWPSRFLFLHSKEELMGKALWDATGGEPANAAARELCRRWGEDQ